MDHLRTIEKHGLKFEKDLDFGFITTALTELGSGLRASVHLKLPHFYEHFDEQKVRELEG